MTALDSIRAKRTEIERIAASYGARDIRVFGSVARGDNRSDSDVDFLVKLDPGRSLFDQAGLLAELRDLLNREVDVVTEDGLHYLLRRRILKEALNI